MQNHVYRRYVCPHMIMAMLIMFLREISPAPEQLRSAGTVPRQSEQHQQQQQQPQQQYQYHPQQHLPPSQHQNPLNAVRKTMSTMETLGIRLPPPGFRAQDAPQPTTTTYQQPWRPDAVPNVQITPPNPIHQPMPHSYEQTYDSLTTSGAQFQPESDHFEECGLSYSASLSGRTYSFPSSRYHVD